MKEARCYQEDDFEQLLLSVFQYIRPQNDEEKRRLQEEYLRILEEAPQMWKQLIQENQSIYDRLGYLDVIVYEDLSFERKKLKRGRPKEPKKKEHRITIRLEEDLYRLLKEYCQTKNISKSKASGIDSDLKQQQQKEKLMEEARDKVEQYEAHIDMLLTVHEEVSDKIHWEQAVHSDPPFELGKEDGPNVKELKKRIEEYKPTWRDRFFLIVLKQESGKCSAKWTRPRKKMK